MRPLKLSIGGFTCFRDPTEVSFDDLSLFAIEGPTGSGKSTLLDAMTYALFGQTPRLGGRGLDVLLSPGLDQMQVDFEFETAKNSVYRITRTLHKRGERVEPQVRIATQNGTEWKQLVESEKKKDTNAKVVELLGLDYDGFTRAVMLPQGAFDEFLRGDASKRRKLLVNLLGLDRIEAMRSEAGQRSRDADSRHKSITERLEQDYAGATPERQRDLKDELERLAEGIRALEAERSALSKELEGLSEVKGLLDDLKGVREGLCKLKTEEPQVEAERQALARAERAGLLAPQLQATESQRRKLMKLEGDLARLKERGTGSRVDAATSRERLREAETDAERLPEIARQLEALAEARPLMATLSARGGNLALAGKAQAERLYSDAAWDKLQGFAADLPALRSAHRELLEAQEDARTAQGSLTKLVADKEALEARCESLKQQGKEVREEVERLKAAHEAAVVADSAAALRPHLHLGEPCPVCEQKVNTLPPPLPSQAAEAKRAWDVADKKLEGLRDDYRSAEGELKATRARQGELETRLEAARKREAQRQEALGALEARFTPFKTTEPDEIAKRLEEGKTALLASLAKQVSEKTGGLDPAKAPARLNAEQVQIEKTLRAAREALAKLEAELGTLEAQEALLASQQAELAQDVAAAEAELAAATKAAGFEGAAALREALLGEAQREALSGRIKAHEAQRHVLARQEVELERKLAGRSLDETAYAAAQARKEGLELELAELQQQQGAMKQALTVLNENLAKAKDLRDEAARALRTFETFKQLANDLRGNELPDYLLSRVQSELAVRASQILRDVTEGRFDLRLRDNDFHVLDAWNTGELRSVKTLSGGETFIASLALALALSETIAGNKSLGALFLDEGFGTLDADMLDAVAGVLEALTEQGRLVGIITHVTALTERLPARLRVRKGPGGSTVAWD